MISRKNRLLSGFLSFIMVMTLVVGVLPPIKVDAADGGEGGLEISAPSDGATINGFETVKIKWNKYTGADHYLLVIKDQTTGKKVFEEEVSYSNSSTRTYNIYSDDEVFAENGHEYKIYVVAMDENGDELNNGAAWHAIYVENCLKLETPEIISHSYLDTHCIDNTLYVEWDPVDGADDYTAYVKKLKESPNFESDNEAGTNIAYTWSDDCEIKVATSKLVAGKWYKIAVCANNNAYDIQSDWTKVYILMEESGYLNVSEYPDDLDAEKGSTGSFWIESNVDWEISCNVSWVTWTVNQVDDTHAEIVVKATSANTGISEREAKFTISADGVDDKYVYVTQLAPEIELPSFGNVIISENVTLGENITWSANVYGNGSCIETVTVGIYAKELNDSIYFRNTNINQETYLLKGSVATGRTVSGYDASGNAKTMDMSTAGKYTVTLHVTTDATTNNYVATTPITIEVTAPAVPEVIDVTWKPETIVEDTNVVYTITTSSNVDTVEFRVDTYLLDTITAYTTSGNNRVFQTTQAIQNPGTREIQVIAYADAVASDTFLQEIVVEEAELEQLQTVTITTPAWDTTITQGESLPLQWTTPSNVSSVDRYIVKIWSDAAQEYTYVKTVYSNSVMVGSYYLQNLGDHSVCVTALKSGYESSETSVHFYVAEAETTLSKPTITGPQSYGTYDAGKDLTFSWNKVSGAAKYYYDVRDITDGEPGVTIFSGSTEEKSVAVPGDVLLAGHVIYLYVYAWSSDAQSEEAFACAVIVKSDVSINISVEKLDFDSMVDSETITLTSSYAWTATPSESWITVNQYSGSSDSQLQIHVTENTTDKIRWGYVTFEDATGSVIVEVYQATSTAAYMNVDTDTIFMGAARGYSDAIAITANVSWRITSDSDWLFASRSSGTYDQDITLIVEANDSESTRTGTVTIYSGSMSETITVIQEGGAAPTISNFITSYTTELGDDVPLQGIVTAVNNGKLKKVTIKCSNAGGTENVVATVDLKQEDTNRFDLANLKFATTNSNIFAGAGTYTFVIYASADNFTVTNNQIGSFTVTVNNTTVLPSAADKGYMNLTATSVTLMGAIENYGSGTFEECGFDLYDADANWIKSYTMKRPTNNSNSFQRTVTGLLPETTYYYCPYIVTSEGIFPAEDNRALIEVTTGKATPIQGIVLLDGTGNPITTSELYGVNGDVLQFGVKTENDSGDIKSVTWLTPNSKIYSINSSSEKECSIVLNETGTDGFSVNVTDYCGNEYCVAVFVNVYEEEISYRLKYSDSLSDEDARTYNYLELKFDTRYFYNPSTMYNNNLAKMSMGFVLAAQSTSAGKTESGIVAEKKRTEAIQGVYDAFGFENVEYYNYDLSLLDCDDKIAYSFATKEILVDGVAYTLIVCITRGGNYGGEWASNFNVGNGTYHKGFTDAATKAYESFLTYCSDKKIDLGGNVKVLITGYSRSASVSNIIAKNVNSVLASHGNSNANVYAYTFATPNNTIADGNTDMLLEGCENIFNIVSRDDFVPYVPMTSWGFWKYGNTLYLPKYGTKESNEMLQILENSVVISNIYDSTFQDWAEQEDAAKQLAILLRYTFGTLGEFNENYQSLVTSIANDNWDTEDGIGVIEAYVLICFAIKAVIKYAENKLTHLPVDKILSFVMGDYLAAPDLQQYQKLISALLDSFDTRDDAQKNLIIKFLVGMNVEEFIEFLEAADTALWLGGKWIDIYVEYYKPMFQLGGHIIATHRMETYLAWLESADAKTLFSDSFDMYNISVACPVNINIYDEEDVLVGRVVNDEIDTSFDLADSIVLSVTDDVKSISIYDDVYYRIEIIPIAEGDMTISIHGTSIVGSGIYENVVLHTDSEYQLIPKMANNGNLSYELIDTKLDTYAVSEIDNDILLMINCDSDGNGHCVGGGLVAYNEYVTLTAVPYEKEAFIGWYLNDTLLSTEISYSFFAAQSQTITAKFTENASSLTGDLNGDGVVDTADVALISDWFAGKYASLPFDTTVADFNGDGLFTRADGMYLARAVAGWDGYKVG